MAQDAESKLKAKVKERIIGVITSVFVFLLSFYLQSFASTEQLDKVIHDHKLDIERMQSNDKVIMSALCIMDKRTCELVKNVR